MDVDFSSTFPSKDMNEPENTDDFDQLIGDHETFVSEDGNLQTDNKKCQKNQGHVKFIPIQELSLKHLPDDHSDQDVYDYIKATADLTVKIDVKMISQNRPECWPGTSNKYPFYNNRGQTHLCRTGSGIVSYVLHYSKGIHFDKEYEKKRDYTKCWCSKCQDSDSPSDVWWEFYVSTATHVVFDENEAIHTKMSLFYDSESSECAILDKFRIMGVNASYDLCELKSVTCDKSLGNTLVILWQRFESLSDKIIEKYKNSKNTKKLAFIVSHPHGYPKQVSFGNWEKKVNSGNQEFSKFTYNVCTCPGSSGACVQCLGYNIVWGSEIVHSGSGKSGYNYSGATYVE